MRYALNTGDLNRGSIWEHRSIFLFYYDFVVDLLKLLVYSVFFGVVVMYYGVPLHIIRDLYLTIRSFVIKIKDIYRYRRATANMNERYPVASAEELAATDRVCIICREEMESARKLPCGHLFHFRCLRSWLERQQACPTCRRPILEEQPTPQAPVEGEGQAMVWRNGRWEPLIAGNGAQQGPIVQNPDLRGQPDIVVDNAGPALVFPNLQPPPPQLPPAMAGNVIPGPFGTVPVILIPPEQIAVFRPPRAPQTPDPQPTNTLEDDQNVPQRPQSAMPTGLRRTIEPAPPKPIYFLKSVAILL